MKRPMLSNRLLAACAFVVLTFLYAWQRPGGSAPNQESCASRALAEVRSCFIQKLEELGDRTWSELHHIVTQCSNKHLQVPMQLVKSGTDKLFVEHKPDVKGCTVLSIGIGNETLFEGNMRKTYRSDCQFFGADPIEEMTVAFRPFGKIFVFAVDDSYGTKRLNLLSTDGQYKFRDAKTVPFNAFMDEHVQSNIDFLALDAEGSEYRILSQIATNPPKVKICQMGLELHGPLETFNMTSLKVQQVLLPFFRQSTYVPIGAYAPGMHHRFSVFNMDPYCIDRFRIDCKQEEKPKA